MRKKSLVSIALFTMIFFSCLVVRGANLELEKQIDNSTAQTQPETGQNITKQEKELESNKYIISEGMIYRVLPETNIETFKKSFTIPDDIKIFKDNSCLEEVTSGFIGTGMTVKNITDNSMYTISVIGDFNNDGRISQVELTQLIRHVVGLNEYQLNGAILKSADLNNDNKVNTIDITIMIRYIVYGELDIEEASQVKSPTIEIISGTQGTNDWYTSNVELRIIANEDNVNIDKTTYKISGSKQVAETEIKAGETINLEQGTYQISAYTYSKSGFKSLATRETIKIDNTLPTIGKLNMWLDEKKGAIYTSDTWTLHDVVVSLENGSDNESGHFQTTYSIGDNSNLTEDFTFSEDGIYNIEVETIDNAGNRSIANYIVKIDKNLTPAPSVKVVSGTKNPGSEWYCSDIVVLEVKNEGGTGANANITKNTYTIEGISDEKEIGKDGRITINENGTFIITVYSYNEAGKRSEGTTIMIKKDNTIPDVPKVEVISGTFSEDKTWYINDVTIKITQAETIEPLSKINKITYKIEGTNAIAETEIENLGEIKITKDGISKLIVCNYNEAGTPSEEVILTIQKDSIAPSASISAKDIGVDSFTLVGEASDVTSGIVTYEFYVDDELISKINTNVKTLEIPVSGKNSGIYKAHIIVKDAAGHITKSDVIDVQTARLTKNELDYFEFVITDFRTENGGQTVQDGALYTVSDTSLTTNPKYIMVNSKNLNTQGTVEGKLRLVRNNGTVVEVFDYFPENLEIEMEFYAYGSGSSFTHKKEANFFGINLNSKNVDEGQTATTKIVISAENIEKNVFTVVDKKQSGTQTYTRATVNSIILNGEKYPFRIVEE